MKRSYAKWNSSLMALALVMVLALSSCSKNQTVVPLPAPVPANPNPIGGGGFTGGVGCGGAVGGTPLNPSGQPYYGTLQGSYSSGGTMTLFLSYLTTPAVNAQQNIVGSVQLSIPEMAQIYPNSSTVVCASSTDPSNGQPIPGTLQYGYGGGYISMTMKGIIQVPGSSYGGYYPGGQAPMIPEYVQVDLQGQVDNNSGRFVGNVWVQIGQTYGYSLSYRSRQ